MLLVTIKLRGRPDWSQFVNDGRSLPSVFRRAIGHQGVCELFQHIAQILAPAYVMTHSADALDRPYKYVELGDKIDGNVNYGWQVEKLPDDDWSKVGIYIRIGEPAAAVDCAGG